MNITISKKDIRKNQKYKEEVEMLEIRKIDYDFLVEGAVTYGSDWERNCTGKIEERWNKRRNYIDKMANLCNERQDELLNMILQLLTENVAMKKALKEAKISIYLTD